MTENEFLLQDRLQKIRSMNEQYNLEANAYLSFSGGRDSTILHHLLDEALPGNKIPRVYINTGIEYKEVLKFVRSLQERDPRVIIYNSGVNIKQMLETKGYPFKSKEHAMTLSIYQNSGRTKTVKKYLGEEPGHTCPKYMCPPKLRYQFSEDFKINISKKCCNELKKKPAARYAREAGKSITITGMRSSEGGQRSNISCSSFEDNRLVKFHPLVPVPGEWMSWYQRERDSPLITLLPAVQLPEDRLQRLPICTRAAAGARHNALPAPGGRKTMRVFMGSGLRGIPQDRVQIKNKRTERTVLKKITIKTEVKTMALKNLFDMVKADRYTQDGREAIIKAQEEETEDKVYQIGEISQKTGLQKTANGWVKPKNSAGRNHGTEQKKRGPGAIHTPGKGSVGIDKMKEAAEKGLKGQELKEFMTGAKTGESKPAVENKTTVRQGPKTKTLNETPAEHVQKNLDAYTGYSPYDMEELVLKPSGYEKSRSTKGPDGVSSITYKKDGGDDILLFFDKYGELKNAGTSQNREGVMQKMRAAEGYGHMKVVGDYDVYRVTSGPDKGKYKVSKVGSLREVTMSEEKAADFLTSAAGKNKTANKDSAPSLSEIVDRVYNIGEISEKTGLQKTANGWVKPKKGAAPAKKENPTRTFEFKAGPDGNPVAGSGKEVKTYKTKKEAQEALKKQNAAAGNNLPDIPDFKGMESGDYDKKLRAEGWTTGGWEGNGTHASAIFKKGDRTIRVNEGQPGKITSVQEISKPAAAPKLNQVEKVDGANRPYRIKGTQFYFDTPEEAETAIVAGTRGDGKTWAKPSSDATINEIQNALGFRLDTLGSGKSMDKFMKKTGDNEYAANVWSFGTDSKGTLINPLDETDKPNAVIKKENGEWKLHYKDREGKETIVTATGRQDPTRDSAPRVLTGDCRIRIRKEKPALTGDTKIRVRK